MTVRDSIDAPWRAQHARALGNTRTARLAAALAVVGLLTVARPVFSQGELHERRLPVRPAAQLTEPFSDIAGVRELADGRLIVLDATEQRLALVDLGKRTVRPIGGRGKGPGEFTRAVRLVALPGDTTFVLDAGAGRILVLGPNGAPNGVITTFGPVPSEAGLGTNALRDVDIVHGAYFQGRVGRMTETGFEQSDSARILRLDRATGRVDSLVSVSVPKTKVTIAREGQTITAVNVSRPPFGVGDEWAVGDDGRIVIARRVPYRLDVMSRGRTSMRGAVVPAAERRLEAGDKSEYVARLANGASIDPNTLDWPERMPIFLPGAVLALPNGEAWVRRTGPSAATTSRYDVFDATARLVATVVTAASQRIVLVTQRGVYVARSDDDGLQYLERFALPR